MRNQNELYHHGIMGMKWGVRRYQNPDGTYTAAGKARRRTGELRDLNQNETKRNDKVKRALTIGAAVAATALITYGGYRVSKEVQLNKKISKTVDQAIKKYAQKSTTEMFKTWKETFGEDPSSDFVKNWYNDKANPSKERIFKERKALKIEYKNARKIYKKLGKEFGVKHPDWKFFDENIAPIAKYMYKE